MDRVCVSVSKTWGQEEHKEKGSDSHEVASNTSDGKWEEWLSERNSRKCIPCPALSASCDPRELSFHLFASSSSSHHDDISPSSCCTAAKNHFSV